MGFIMWLKVETYRDAVNKSEVGSRLDEILWILDSFDVY